MTIAGLDLVADGEIAPLKLEAARAENLAVIQALVQRGEVADALGTNIDAAGLVGHDRAARVVTAAAAARDLALQIHQSGRLPPRPRAFRVPAWLCCADRSMTDPSAWRILPARLSRMTSPPQLLLG
ncbi:hypothetical protein ACU4GD_31790 [Cupriavidus basilensis]